MKLSFNNPYRSIINFPLVELPDFTVITGVNGTGKTHLLRAIVDGAILTDVTQELEKEIKFFDWNMLTPNNAGEVQVNSLYQERDQFISIAYNARQEYSDRLNFWADKYGVRVQDRLALLREDKNYFSTVIDNDSRVDEAWSQLEAIGKEISNVMQNSMGKSEPMSAFFQKLSSMFGLGVVSPQNRDFSDNIYGASPANFFQHSFGQIFLAYFELKRQNKFRLMDEQENQTPDEPSLSPEEFVGKYNEPPWEFVNGILRDANLDFNIDHPYVNSTTKFTPQLRKITTGAEIRFSDLSSGEKVLMSFALCLYHTLDTRQEVVFPKLLLFDEIDAPLHPSMARQLVNTIQKSLVEEKGVKVILATHSPSTVAVCPEDSLHVMLPNKAGLHKVKKRQAISTLTSEIPTLSISYSGQRQVFVESHLDADRYSKIYQILSSDLKSERSLSFIGVGKRSKNGDENSGRDYVKNIVTTLVKQGNESVFGLIDWDLTNKTGRRVFVLAEESRYGIENCLLDPLLVAAVAVSVDRENMGPIVGLPEGKGLTYLSNINQPECQAIVTNVEKRVLGVSDSDTVLVNYIGGLQAKVSQRYLTMNCHELEDKVKEKFDVLGKFQHTGALLKHVIGQVLFEHHGLAPIELKQVFQKILQYELSDER